MMGGNGSYPDLLWGTKLVTQISGISSPTDTFSSDVQNPQHGTFPKPCLGGHDVSGIFWVPSCLKPGPWAIAYEPRRCPQLTWANGGSESWPATAESAEGGTRPLEIWPSPRNRPRCSLYKLVKGITTRLGCEPALTCWRLMPWRPHANKETVPDLYHRLNFIRTVRPRFVTSTKAVDSHLGKVLCG